MSISVVLQTVHPVQQTAIAATQSAAPTLMATITSVRPRDTQAPVRQARLLIPIVMMPMPMHTPDLQRVPVPIAETAAMTTIAPALRLSAVRRTDMPARHHPFQINTAQATPVPPEMLTNMPQLPQRAEQPGAPAPPQQTAEQRVLRLEACILPVRLIQPLHTARQLPPVHKAASNKGDNRPLHKKIQYHVY